MKLKTQMVDPQLAGKDSPDGWAHRAGHGRAGHHDTPIEFEGGKQRLPLCHARIRLNHPVNAAQVCLLP